MKHSISATTSFSSRATTTWKASAIAAVLVASFGFVPLREALAASCEGTLQSHVDWLSNQPNDVERTVKLVMVSNEANTFQSVNGPTPEATYVETALEKGSWYFDNPLVGSGAALFNNRTHGGFADHPFDPNDSDTWTIILTPSSNSSMLLVRDGKTFNVPLDRGLESLK